MLSYRIYHFKSSDVTGYTALDLQNPVGMAMLSYGIYSFRDLPNPARMAMLSYRMYNFRPSEPCKHGSAQIQNIQLKTFRTLQSWQCSVTEYTVGWSVEFFFDRTEQGK